MLHVEGFENDGALDFAIKKLEASLKKSKKKDGDEEPVSPVAMSITVTHTLLQEEPANFPLVDVPDTEVRRHHSTRMTFTEDAEARRRPTKGEAETKVTEGGLGSSYESPKRETTGERGTGG